MRVAAALLGLVLASSSLAEQQDSAQQHVRGDVVAVNGDALDVRTRAGQVVHLTLAGNVGVAQVEEAGPEAITDGAFVGTTAVPQGDGTLRAVEVHVFPKE